LGQGADLGFADAIAVFNAPGSAGRADLGFADASAFFGVINKSSSACSNWSVAFALTIFEVEIIII